MRLSSLRRWFRAPSRGFVRPSRPRRPEFEVLEDRAVPAVLTVTGVGDSIAVDGVVTLREAITAANTNQASGDAPAGEVGLDTIKFNINAPGVQTIHLTGALPAITEQLVLNGYSQGIASPNTLPVGDNANLLIELDGSGAGANADGLVIDAGAAGSTVRGLVINRFGGTGISVLKTNNVTLAGNFLGTDPSGTLDRGNGAGIVFFDTVVSTIGGTMPAARNVISGNIMGIVLDGNGGGFTNNAVLGNYIGTDASGLAGLGNQVDGIRILKDGGNTIGAPGMGNVISANGTAGSGNGISLAAASNTVQGNLIGTDATGTKALGNKTLGMELSSLSPSNMIGGTAAGAGNVLSGNSFGISINSDSNTLQGNFIGTDVTGTKALPNTFNGVSIFSGTTNAIGGTAAGAGNVLSGNGGDGVRISTDGNVVQGNRIGVAFGGAPLGNGGDGIELLGNTPPSANLIGGTAAGAANLIAFNAGAGVSVNGATGALGNAVLGNAIYSNQLLGIDLATNNTQTGPTPNDTGDGDPGANQLQNFPVLTSAVTTAANTTIQGTLISTPNTTFRVELFSNDTADPSGFGQGQQFLGFTDVMTDAQGNALFTFTPSSPVPVGQFMTATATDPMNNTSEFSAAVVVTSSGGGGGGGGVVHLFAVGAGPGGLPEVKVFNADGSLRFDLLAYGGFQGGVRVATGDVTGDGVDDIITGAGPGAPGGHVKVFDGATGQEIGSFLAYAGPFAGGVFVGCGDVTGDGRADIITGAGAGAGPHVKVFDGVSGAEVRSFFAYIPSFTGGVTVAAGDLDGDGHAEIITGAGVGAAGGHVKAFDGLTGAEVRSFLAYPGGFAGGVFVAAGDVDGDGQADIVTGAGAGAGPHVKVFRGTDTAVLNSFFALGSSSLGGVRVAADDLDGDGKADLIAGAGVGSQVRVVRGADLAALDDFFALAPALAGGVFVG